MPVIEFGSFIESVKATYSIAKGLKVAYDAHAIAQAQSDILERLLIIQQDALSLQENHAALIDHNQKLQTELANFVKWEEIASQYKLVNVDLDRFVYALKKSQEPKEPPHWLCTNCFNQRKKSILQPSTRSFSQLYKCPICGLELFVRGNPQYAA